MADRCTVQLAYAIGVADPVSLYVNTFDHAAADETAVEAAIRVLEDSPFFNAGNGAVFNAAGKHELDASIMDGSNLACGVLLLTRRKSCL